MIKEMKGLYTIAEVADILRVDRVTVWRYVKQGKIDAVKIGSTIRIPREAIPYLFPEEDK